jgi:DNA polymerase-1
VTTLLIDADSLVYEAALSVEVEIEWTEDLWTLHSELPPAKRAFDEKVDALLARLDGDAAVMALSDYTDPWRKRVMPTYKSNRKRVRRPVVFGPLREYVHSAYRTFQRPGLEGDDVLGILLTNSKIIPGDKICVSLDKDMKTLPGLHFNMRTDFPFTVTRPEADYNHLMQTLTGDQTDGYPGCKGVGPVSAAKLLAPFKTTKSFDVPGAWAAVVAAYEKAGLTAEDALTNARVARICRNSDYDFQAKEVKLWTP